MPEVRFAVNFEANCARRMQMFPAAYQIGGESDNPIPLAQVHGIPTEIVQAATAAMTALGNGRLAMGGLLHARSTNAAILVDSHSVQ